jgi:hypothetical protein
MPPPKNRATARFFGVQRAKKRPSRRDVFLGMPPPIGEIRTGVVKKESRGKEKLIKKI